MIKYENLSILIEPSTSTLPALRREALSLYTKPI